MILLTSAFLKKKIKIKNNCINKLILKFHYLSYKQHFHDLNLVFERKMLNFYGSQKLLNSAFCQNLEYS